MTNNDGYLTLEQVARILNVHYNTVYRWVVKERILPGVQIVRGWRVSQYDLDEFIKNRKLKDNENEH